MLRCLLLTTTLAAASLTPTGASAQLVAADSFDRTDSTNLGATELGGFTYQELDTPGAGLSVTDVARIDRGQLRVTGPDALPPANTNPAVVSVPVGAYDVALGVRAQYGSIDFGAHANVLRLGLRYGTGLTPTQDALSTAGMIDFSLNPSTGEYIVRIFDASGSATVVESANAGAPFAAADLDGDGRLEFGEPFEMEVEAVGDVFRWWMDGVRVTEVALPSAMTALADPTEATRVLLGRNRSAATGAELDVYFDDLRVAPADGCPMDGEKLVAGECGCGVPDVDADEDGTFECNVEELLVADAFERADGTDLGATEVGGIEWFELTASGGVVAVRDSATLEEMQLRVGEEGTTNPSLVALPSVAWDQAVRVTARLIGEDYNPAGVANGIGIQLRVQPLSTDDAGENVGRRGLVSLSIAADGTYSVDVYDAMEFDVARNRLVASEAIGAGWAAADTDGDGVLELDEPLEIQVEVQGGVFRWFLGGAQVGSDLSLLRTSAGLAITRGEATGFVLNRQRTGTGTLLDIAYDDLEIAYSDLCPSDTTKLVAGTCGCGTPDVDSDGNGVIDCEEVNADMGPVPSSDGGPTMGTDGGPAPAGDAGMAPPSGGDDGCGCRVAGGSSRSVAWGLVSVLLGLLALRRRR